MGSFYEILCTMAVSAWVLSRLLIWFVGPQNGVIAGVAVAIALSIAGFIWPVTNWPVAIFSPISLGIAAIATADLARPFGLRAPRWSLVDMSVILVLYCTYIFASVGGLAFDPYALGFSGGVGLGVPVVLAGYAYMRKDWLLAAIVIGAQMLWLAGIGSENLFDHLVSVLLLPALAVGTARRLQLR